MIAICCEVVNYLPKESTSVLEIISKIATVIIALFNLGFAIYIFRKNFKTNTFEKEKDRKIQLFKTLILDHNLKEFYGFFYKLESCLIKLQKENLSESERTSIISESDAIFIELSRSFTDTLLAVDSNLYNNILDKSDSFQEELNYVISDKGIVLSHLPKFEEQINQKISRFKTDILTVLYNYR
jgi:hypothetical protein